MKIHCLQHEPFEDPGTILEWASERKHAVGATMVYKGEPLPAVKSFDLLVVMGGSMSVNDEGKFPWLVPEKQLVRKAIDKGKAVLGICLGAQLVAAALGALVRKNAHKEIGWFPVTLTAQGITSDLFLDWPLVFPVFHWHGDTFEIPPGAVRVASSRGCANQAFVYGRTVVALQFHVESTADAVKRLLTACKDEVVDGHRYIQTAERISAQKQYFPCLRTLLFRLLDRMTGNV